MIARHIIGAVVMLMASCIIAALFVFPIPNDNQDIALVMLGVVLGWAGNVVQFHFGSSDGSKKKSQHIESMAEPDVLELNQREE